MGYGDVGCYGQELIKTPNIDRMAAEGMRFTQAYAGSAVCAPTRCVLMTGLHTGHCTRRDNTAKAGGPFTGRPLIPLDADDFTVAAQWGMDTRDIDWWPTERRMIEWLGEQHQEDGLASVGLPELATILEAAARALRPGGAMCFDHWTWEYHLGLDWFPRRVVQRPHPTGSRGRPVTFRAPRGDHSGGA